MKLIEILILSAFAVLVIIAIWQIFFSKKKKKEKKEKKSKEKKTKQKAEKKSKEQKEKQKEESGKTVAKIEPVMKSEQKKPEDKKEEKQEPQKSSQPTEKEKTLEKEPEKKGLFVIRPKTELKINKKALKNGSRNPSVSRVFDKNGNKIDEEKVVEEPEEQMHATDIKKKPVERFGTREYEYSEQNSPEFFKINAPKGSPLRAPTIGDRTNFTQRLHVSEDGNLSGITGIGVHGAVASAESQSKEIERKKQDMLARVDESLRNPSFGDALMQYDFSFDEPKETKTRGKKILEKIDPETMIIVDAINNPRHKNNKNTKF